MMLDEPLRFFMRILAKEKNTVWIIKWLSEMSEVNVMWELFAEQLTAAVDTSVPVKQFTKANEREPILFT